MSPHPSTTTGLQRAPLDIYKKITVIREKGDSVVYEDSQGRLQTISNLGDEALSATPSLQPKVKLDIPVPTIKDVRDYERDVPPTFDIPRSYVRYQRPSLEEVSDFVEYNLDEEDETWLFNNDHFGQIINSSIRDEKSLEDFTISRKISSLSDESSSAGFKLKPTLPLEYFEHMLDILEKATAFETIITMEQAERLIIAKIPQILQIFGTSHTAGPLHNQELKKQHITKHDVNVKTVITEVYNYWVNKRSKLRKPLLRKYWPITASNDTNPHMVFRPREKEKYKLRKKRQNDLDAFKKMKQLKIDFAKVLALLELVRQREQINKVILDMQCDWFEQRLYDMIDTSALPRESDRLSHDEIEATLNVPKLFDAQNLDRGKNKKKRKRVSLPRVGGARTPPVTAPTDVTTSSHPDEIIPVNPSVSAPVSNKPKVIAADQDNPPSFLHPLTSRETYTSSWENSVPFITSYVNAQPVETNRFRHRPRIGRGGRVMIDRIPYPNHPDDPIRYFYTVGDGAKLKSSEGKSVTRMLDVLPVPLNAEAVRRRIEEISAAALAEEEEDRSKRSSRVPMLPSSSITSGVTDDGNVDTEDIIVKYSDWLDADEQMFGEEVIPAIGPV